MHPVLTQLITDIEDVDKLIEFCSEPRNFSEILSFMNFADRTYFRKKIYASSFRRRYFRTNYTR